MMITWRAFSWVKNNHHIDCLGKLRKHLTPVLLCTVLYFKLLLAVMQSIKWRHLDLEQVKTIESYSLRVCHWEYTRRFPTTINRTLNNAYFIIYFVTSERRTMVLVWKMKVSIFLILLQFSTIQSLDQVKVPTNRTSHRVVVSNQGFQAIVTERKVANAQRSNKIKEKEKGDEEEIVTKQWMKMEEKLLKYFQHSIHSNLMPTFESLFQNNNVSIRCQSTIQRILLDASQLQKYAIQSKPAFTVYPPCHYTIYPSIK